MLLVDGAMVKILTQTNQSFQVIHELESAYQHTPSKDMATDKDENFYSGNHHSKVNTNKLHELAETTFILEIADFLKENIYANKFNELTLIYAT